VEGAEEESGWLLERGPLGRAGSPLKMRAETGISNDPRHEKDQRRDHAGNVQERSRQRKQTSNGVAERSTKETRSRAVRTAEGRNAICGSVQDTHATRGERRKSLRRGKAEGMT
jgi:hypothetical protein